MWLQCAVLLAFCANKCRARHRNARHWEHARRQSGRADHHQRSLVLDEGRYTVIVHARWVHGAFKATWPLAGASASASRSGIEAWLIILLGVLPSIAWFESYA